jgi:hypothetical protein
MDKGHFDIDEEATLKRRRILTFVRFNYAENDK